MQTKWLAPACYVGVAALCALYLAVVPGVTFTNVAAGAGIGAALMWAINEWEAGKWKFERVVQALPAASALAAAAPVATEAAVAQTAQPVEMAQPASQPAPTAARATARTAPPPASSQSWEIDDAEPSWDPSALAETWAKLRRDLSISGSSARTTPPAPDLPRTAQLAKGSQLAKAQLPGLAARSAEAAKTPASHAPAAKAASSRYTAAPAPAKTSSYAQPQQPTNSSWSSRPAATPANGSYGKPSHNATAPAAQAAQPAAPRRPTEPAPQRAAQPAPSFLRTSAMRPR